MRTDCFQEGVTARAAGQALSDNPYPIRTEEHEDWAAGWRATFDLDEDDDPGSTRSEPMSTGRFDPEAGQKRG